MVLRLAMITLFCFATNSFARVNSSSYFKRAQIYFKKQDYKNSLANLSKAYNLKRPKSIPRAALFLIGQNLQKLNMPEKSNYYFNQLIKHSYLKKHVQVIKAFKQNKTDEVEIPKTLGLTYLHLGINYHALFNRQDNLQSAEKAHMYYKICDDTDSNDQCSSLLEKINNDIAANKLKQKSYKFYIQAARYLFQDRVEIEETSSGLTSSLVSNNASVCYGAGLRYGSAIKGLDFSGCAFSGTTTVDGVASSQSGSNNNYKQSGVPIAGVLFESGYYYKFDLQKAHLAASIPILYRAGSYSEPTGFKINNMTDFNFGVSFTAGLEISFFEFQLKLGHMQNANSLMLNSLYIF